MTMRTLSLTSTDDACFLDPTALYAILRKAIRVFFVPVYESQGGTISGLRIICYRLSRHHPDGSAVRRSRRYGFGALPLAKADRVYLELRSIMDAQSGLILISTHTHGATEDEKALVDALQRKVSDTLANACDAVRTSGDVSGLVRTYATHSIFDSGVVRISISGLPGKCDDDPSVGSVSSGESVSASTTTQRMNLGYQDVVAAGCAKVEDNTEFRIATSSGRSSLICELDPRKGKIVKARDIDGFVASISVSPITGETVVTLQDGGGWLTICLGKDLYDTSYPRRIEDFEGVVSVWHDTSGHLYGCTREGRVKMLMADRDHPAVSVADLCRGAGAPLASQEHGLLIHTRGYNQHLGLHTFVVGQGGSTRTSVLFMSTHQLVSLAGTLPMPRLW